MDESLLWSWTNQSFQDVLKYHVLSYFKGFDCASQLRTVCKSWRVSFPLLPKVIVTEEHITDENRLIKRLSLGETIELKEISEKSLPVVLRHLKNSEKLSHLDLNSCKSLSKCIGALDDALGSLPNTNRLTIHWGLLFHENSKLPSSAFLTHLNISGNHISEDTALALAESLPQAMPQLRSLRFSLCGLRHASSLIIISALPRLAKLSALDLSMNPGIACDDIANLLRVSSSLQELNLRSTALSLSDISAIAGALAQNTSLTHLNVSWQEQQSSFSILPLAEALIRNKTLTHLDISDIIVNKEHIQSFFDSLELNRTLTSLRARNIALRDAIDDGDTSSLLYDFLRSNQGLKRLELSFSLNLMDEASLLSLGKSLIVNKFLQQLDISGSHVSIAVATVLSEAIRANKNLRLLVADPILFSSQDAMAPILSALSESKSMAFHFSSTNARTAGGL